MQSNGATVSVKGKCTPSIQTRVAQLCHSERRSRTPPVNEDCIPRGSISLLYKANRWLHESNPIAAGPVFRSTVFPICDGTSNVLLHTFFVLGCLVSISFGAGKSTVLASSSERSRTIDYDRSMQSGLAVHVSSRGPSSSVEITFGQHPPPSPEA